MLIEIPRQSIVVLVGGTPTQQQSLATKWFGREATFVWGDEDHTAPPYVARRLVAGQQVVICARNHTIQQRSFWIQWARKYHLDAFALVVADHYQVSLKSLRKLEGFADVFVVPKHADVVVNHTRLPLDLRHMHGPFDVVGDVHGCFDELLDLLQLCGYVLRRDEGSWLQTHPQNRIPVFVGDLVDRGPDVMGVLNLVMDLCYRGQALCVLGNHDDKLKRRMQGHDVTVSPGLQVSLDQLTGASPNLREKIIQFIDHLEPQLLLDGGRLAVSHAGLKEEFIGRRSTRIKHFCLYGDPTGELDEFGFPERYPWQEEYRGDTHIIYGHTPVHAPCWIHKTANVDTGCVFGGLLTAVQYPELTFSSIEAKCVYYHAPRPFRRETP